MKAISIDRRQVTGIVDTKRTAGVDSARKVLSALLLFESKPVWNVEEVADALHCSLATAYRYVSLLREMGFIEEDGLNSYTLSGRVLGLANSLDASPFLARRSRLILEELSASIGETCVLLRRIGDHSVSLAIHEPEQRMRISFRIGAGMPLHLGAGAKVLLAHCGRAWAEAYFRRLPESMSEQEIETRLSELDRIRANGYAESAAEVDEGVCAVAVFVAAAGPFELALSVAAPAHRFNAEAEKRNLAAARQTAKKLASLATGSQR